MILAASCGTEDKAEWGSAQSGVHAGLVESRLLSPALVFYVNLNLNFKAANLYAGDNTNS